MRYISKPEDDKNLKVLERIEKAIKGSLAANNVDKVIEKFSGLLVTAIKQNDEISKVHASQITRVISDIREANPVAEAQAPSRRTFHMDVNRGSNGFIESVDGTIEG